MASISTKSAIGLESSLEESRASAASISASFHRQVAMKEYQTSIDSMMMMKCPWWAKRRIWNVMPQSNRSWGGKAKAEEDSSKSYQIARFWQLMKPEMALPQRLRGTKTNDVGSPMRLLFHKKVLKRRKWTVGPCQGFHSVHQDSKCCYKWSLDSSTQFSEQFHLKRWTNYMFQCSANKTLANGRWIHWIQLHRRWTPWSNDHLC